MTVIKLKRIDVPGQGPEHDTFDAERGLVYEMSSVSLTLWRHWLPRCKELEPHVRKISAVHPLLPIVLQDVFACMFEKRPKARTEGWRPHVAMLALSIIDLLESTTEWEDLRRRCRMRAGRSMAAVLQMAEIVSDLPLHAIPLPEDGEEEALPYEEEREIGQGLGQSEDESLAIRERAALTMKEIQESLNRLDEAEAVFGSAGDGLETPVGFGNDGEREEALFQLATDLENDTRMQQMLETLGRFKTLLSEAGQSEDLVPGLSYVTGISSTRRFKELLPTERARMFSGSRAARSLRLHQFQTQGGSKHAREDFADLGDGPFIIIIDVSYSMAGGALDAAVALAGAAALMASDEERLARIIAFSDAPYEIEWDRSSPALARQSLKGLCSLTAIAGTRVLPALAVAERWLKQQEVPDNADILLLTDGVMGDLHASASASALEQFRTLRASFEEVGTRLHYVLVGHSHHASPHLRDMAHQHILASSFFDDALARSAVKAVRGPV